MTASPTGPSMEPTRPLAARGGARRLPPVGTAGEHVLREALAALRGRVERALAKPDPHRRARVEVEVGGVDPLAFLASQAPGERAYFRSRDGLLAAAMVGHALVAPELADPELAAFLRAVPAARAFVALRFDPAREAGLEWMPFTAAPVAVPAVELVRSGIRTVLAANLVGDGQATIAALARIEASETAHDGRIPMAERPVVVDSSSEAWESAIRATLEEIAKGSARKIVLARTRSFRVPEELDPCELLARLAENEPGTYQFLVEPRAGVAFVGASPERLFRRSGTAVESEAVAGTRRRGDDPELDATLAEELGRSAKDRHEQKLVLDRVVERLGPVADRVTVAGAPRILRLAHVMHLRSAVTATLRGVEGADPALLEALHPTPAVCGLPAERARTVIRACEPFDRGLYAGPIGLVGAETEFCVAIRSALVAGRTVTAFAGAGVVAGSDAAAEWRETEHKLATFERLVRPS